MTSPFSPILGGFECGTVPAHDGEHNLLETTRHLPSQRMRQHYEIAKAHGMTTVRDGVAKGEDIRERFKVAKDAGMKVIWDVVHFHQVNSEVATWWGYQAGRFHQDTYGRETELWLCPLNEIETYHWVTGNNDGMDRAKRLWHDAADGAEEALGKRVRFVSSSVINHPDDDWSGIDAIAERCEVIGLNFYPHAVRHPIDQILIEAHRRTGKPVMITETGFHNGHPEHHGTKAEWLRHVLDAVERADVPYWGTTIYPLVNCTRWDRTQDDEWDHGLIRLDGGLDEEFGKAIMEAQQ